ncbi:MAG: DUF5752 family protein [Candidatus Verstraetearchaeota archaeon]|nr:DUF5752 family protein [Candidatus Verstraetearchaeota archaeon]
MKKIVFFFEMHQPRRIKRNFSITSFEEMNYFDDELNKEIFQRISKKCYIPTLEIFLENSKKYDFKFSLGISGIFIEQCSWWEPKILELIKELVDIGACELVSETYYHSLASLISEEEFKTQINLQRKILNEIFGVKTIVVENTEFIYNNEIAKIMEELGFKIALTEGTEKVLDWRSPNYLYKAKNANLILLMRNYRLSDDIGFRFTCKDWICWPLTAEKYANWLKMTPGEVIFIAMDFETFGEHHWPESGIHDFIKALPKYIKDNGLEIAKPSEVYSDLSPIDEINVENTISWADSERDLSAWIGNEMQKYCFEIIKYMEPMVKASSKEYLKIWRYFTTSDYFHYMSMKGGGEGAVHSYFSHFNSPIEAFIIFTSILSDFRYKVYQSMGKKLIYYKILFGSLPDSHAFHFYSGFAKPLGIKARNLIELYNAINKIDEEVIIFHIKRGDLSRWISEILGYRELAEKLKKINEKEIKEKVLKIIENEIKKIKNLLYGEEEIEKI